MDHIPGFDKRTQHVNFRQLKYSTITDTPNPFCETPRALRGIHEISHIKDIARFDPQSRKYHSEYLYRILANHELDKWTISQLIENLFPKDAAIISYQEHIDNAYPLLCPRSGDFPSFEVAEIYGILA